MKEEEPKRSYAKPAPLMEGAERGAKEPIPEILEVHHSGLSRREYFAGLAMQGILANSNGSFDLSFKNVSSLSVSQADALLKELDK